MEIMNKRVDSIKEIMKMLQKAPSTELQITKFIRKHMKDTVDITTLKTIIGKLVLKWRENVDRFSEFKKKQENKSS